MCCVYVYYIIIYISICGAVGDTKWVHALGVYSSLSVLVIGVLSVS